jgi:hypothetical protein
MSGRERLSAIAVVLGLCGVSVASSVYYKWQVRQANEITKTAIGYDRLPLKSEGSLPIFVFERANCHVCREFDELYVPMLTSKYGKTISLHISPAPTNIVTPTVVVGGDKPMLWNYRPSWDDLTATIESRLKVARIQRNANIAAQGAAVQ